MTALALLQQLHECSVILTPSPDGTVRCRAPKGVLTPVLLDGMRQHKAELHAMVEVFEERAGIAEFEAGLPRAEAEARAWAYILGHLLPQGCVQERDRRSHACPGKRKGRLMRNVQ